MLHSVITISIVGGMAFLRGAGAGKALEYILCLIETYVKGAVRHMVDDDMLVDELDGEEEGCGCGEHHCTGDISDFDCSEMPDEELLYDLADLFKIFADTTRIKILYALMKEGKSVGAIADEVGASQSAVSHQLRILKQARLVRFRRDGKQVVYSLSDDHVYTMIAQGMVHICE